MNFYTDSFYYTVQVPNEYVTNTVTVYEYFTCIVLVSQLSNAQYAQVNSALPSGWDENIPEKQLKWQRLQINQPFEMKLKNGLVSNDMIEVI